VIDTGLLKFCDAVGLRKMCSFRVFKLAMSWRKIINHSCTRVACTNAWFI